MQEQRLAAAMSGLKAMHGESKCDEMQEAKCGTVSPVHLGHTYGHNVQG
jgi:hypothetical protein